MKRIVFYIGLLCLGINIICGLVLSAYSSFFCTLTSCVIIINMLVMYLVSFLTLKDGFRIAMNVLFPLLFIGEFVCALFSPEQRTDNWFIIILALIIFIEGVILIITNHISKNVLNMSSTQDKIKARALEKYKNYVEGELKRLNDGSLSISEFEPEPSTKDGFTEEELKELSLHFKNLKVTALFVIYCKNNSIDMSKYPNIKGLC